MRGIEQLTRDNHTLYRRVQHLVSLGHSWGYIAEDIGLIGPRAVQELCEWVLEYREPKPLPMVRTSQVYDVPVKSKALAAKRMASRVN